VPALGAQLEIRRGLNDAVGVVATMVVIFAAGALVDTVFGRVDRAVRRRWGLLDTA
jgi:NitT/TauT family transport system permease protein